jgi:hypothetical protein
MVTETSVPTLRAHYMTIDPDHSVASPFPADSAGLSSSVEASDSTDRQVTDGAVCRLHPDCVPAPPAVLRVRAPDEEAIRGPAASETTRGYRGLSRRCRFDILIPYELERWTAQYPAPLEPDWSTCLDVDCACPQSDSLEVD